MEMLLDFDTPSEIMASSSSFQSSSSLPPAMKDRGYINWAELPSELTSSILHRLGGIEILESAQKVCTSWRRVCKDPSMWQKIVMHDLEYLKRTKGNFGMDTLGEMGNPKYNLRIMCRHAVDRSKGGLVEIEIWYFGTDELLHYIAESSSNLRSLELVKCSTITGGGLIQAVLKLPLLEDLQLSYFLLSGESLKVVGQSCPNLKTLKLNRGPVYKHRHIECDDDALAIAATMPGLRYLQLFGNYLTNTGLKAILDKCPNLEHLDLRQCFNVNLAGDLEKRCSEIIKDLRRPNDSTHDYPFDATVVDQDPSDDDYSSYDDEDFAFMPGFD